MIATLDAVGEPRTGVWIAVGLVLGLLGGVLAGLLRAPKPPAEAG